MRPKQRIKVLEAKVPAQNGITPEHAEAIRQAAIGEGKTEADAVAYLIEDCIRQAEKAERSGRLGWARELRKRAADMQASL